MKKLLFLVTLVTLFSCEIEKEGCNDPAALNFDPDATNSLCCFFPFKGTFFTLQDGAQITVSVDGNQVGTIDYYLDTEPECGDTKGVITELTAGTHSYYATDGTMEWNGIIEAERNGCQVIALSR